MSEEDWDVGGRRAEKRRLLEGFLRKLIMCPLKKSMVYSEVCVRKCDWFHREKCPIQEEINFTKGEGE